ncbi:hypothetical protein CCACVL1_29345 [Corchorus capsularis]|uniref:Uncharacterized protein n=1 Tax=Corchorus capsularis TaxID=210143 RepID=A0A1R3G237_COCAP|nr:hypothetical protein CCACVL1_29345 [Corchorus capsularis]
MECNDKRMALDQGGNWNIPYDTNLIDASYQKGMEGPKFKRKPNRGGELDNQNPLLRFCKEQNNIDHLKPKKGGKVGIPIIRLRFKSLPSDASEKTQMLTSSPHSSSSSPLHPPKQRGQKQQRLW